MRCPFGIVRDSFVFCLFCPLLVGKAMVSDHEDNIKEYQKEAQKTDAVGAYAKESLPTLQKHLQAAQKLEQQL